MHVYINPGHAPNGIPDPGAMNYHLEQRESDIALNIGSRVAEYLRKVDIRVTLNQCNSLHDICTDANESCCDLFVSLHCNASNTMARGTETFCYRFNSEGEKLAKCIQDQIVYSLYTIDRGVKEANYTVLVYTDMPAVLVEMEFIDNDVACQMLLDKEDEFARAIARGITDYIQRSRHK